MQKPMYEIRVAGVVPDADLRDLGALTLAPDHVNTILYGIADQAALYGLLARLRTLGLEVIEVRRVSAPDLDTSPHQSTPVSTGEEDG